LFGVTGTIGADVEREEIQRIYDVTTFVVPPHKPGMRKDLEPIICYTPEEYYTAICHDIATMQEQHRATLVVLETISQANEFAKYCSTHHIAASVLTACQSTDEAYIIGRAGAQGRVTIATNTAGRGTDIILHRLSLAKGGLHVIMGFLPSNKRAEYQGLGRAGRQGQSGSSRLIVLVDQVFSLLPPNDVYKLLLALRETQIAALSSSREFRTQIERINHLYLTQFVNLYREWLNKASNHPDLKDLQERIQVAWAEHFYNPKNGSSPSVNCC
jgi:preprotein translocase subunit SecA